MRPGSNSVRGGLFAVLAPGAKFAKSGGAAAGWPKYWGLGAKKASKNVEKEGTLEKPRNGTRKPAPVSAPAGALDAVQDTAVIVHRG